MKKILILMLITFKTLAANTGIDPDFLKLKVYKIAISKDIYCNDLKVVVDNSGPGAIYEDFLTSPTIGSGSVNVGTYQCVVIEFEDIIKFASLENSDNGFCNAGVDLTNEICTSATADSIRYIDGSTSTCTNGSQRTSMWLSTGSTNAAQTGSPFLPPIQGDTDRGLQLLSPLVVSEGSIAKFVVNALGKIEDNGSSCEMQAPTFAFENL